MSDKVIFSGSFERVCELALEYKNQGFTLVFTTKAIELPIFWRYTWHVTMMKVTHSLNVKIETSDVYKRVIADLYGFPDCPLSDFNNSLADQLQSAIEQEDYIEAARLRDIINSKNGNVR
jgi:hypothetical protein